MSVKLACRVQSHPSRRELRERLLPALEGMPVEVVETAFDPPNPWFGYIACLTDPPDCSHLLIVQDDTVACRNLAPALELIAQAVPDNPVCLYMGMLPPQKNVALRAAMKKQVYAELSIASAFLPIVAVLWPIALANDFREWGLANGRTHRNGKPFDERSDDAMGGSWWRRTRQTVYATIPSLIEHPDDCVSTIARSNAGRTALFWHGTEWDALSVDWLQAAGR